jgi:hypothetical protein
MIMTCSGSNNGFHLPAWGFFFPQWEIKRLIQIFDALISWLQKIN